MEGMPMEGMPMEGMPMEGEGMPIEGEVEGFMGAMWNGFFYNPTINKQLLKQQC